MTLSSAGLDSFAIPKAFLVVGSQTLSPLPSDLRSGLYGVTTLGFLSFFSCLSILVLLSWRMFEWLRRGKSPNQFFFLLYNLFLADIQQSLAFLLNARWLVEDAILVKTGTCWAQGWFVSTGDLASGAWCFFIALHTFASVVFNYRLNRTKFIIAIIACWSFIYTLTITGIVMHPKDIYVRAVGWCWTNSKYSSVRLWLHYFWIFIFEIGTVLLYVAMYVTVQYRIKNDYYSASTKQATQARQAAKLILVFPIAYVICTLPLAVLRTISMSSGHTVGFSWFTFAGGMITSNGWVDVLLYTLTRRIMLFSDEPPPDSCGIEDTFTVPWSGNLGKRFGTKTTCEFSGDLDLKRRHAKSWWKFSPNNDVEKRKREAMISFASTDQLFDPMRSPIFDQTSSKQFPETSFGLAVKTKTTIEIRSEPLVELADMRAFQAMKDLGDQSPQQHSSRPHSDKSSLEFATKPEGWP